MKRPMIRRSAFTILELLVVVTIIAVLASLLLASVFKVWNAAYNLDARQELAQMENAIKAFCSDPRFGAVGYFPSRLDPSGTDPASSAYLQRVFPRAQNLTGTGGGTAMPQKLLEGQEVLVLMLGGPNNNGWSMDAQDPTAVYGQHIQFYEFKPFMADGVTPRLVDTKKGNTSFKYYQYLDRWGTPIAYFSPRRELDVNGNATWQSPNYTNDCNALGVKPYATQNLTSFQLISAGPDGKFGTNGATWTPQSSLSIYPHGNPGWDDLANFAPRQLGGQQ